MVNANKTLATKLKLLGTLGICSLFTLSTNIASAQSFETSSLIDELDQIERDLAINIEYDPEKLKGVAVPLFEGEFDVTELIEKMVGHIGLRVAYSEDAIHVLSEQDYRLALESGTLTAKPESKLFNQLILDEEDVEMITVTGSRIRRDSFDSVDIVRTLSRSQAKARGVHSITDALQRSSVVAGLQSTPTTNTQFALSGAAGSREIDLRGLGNQRTLVLINGRAVPPGGVGVNASTSDLSSLPTAITDRIEILSQGASSVYGSESLAGTVNYVTINDLDGVRLEADFTVPTKSGGIQKTLSIALGKIYDNSSFLVAYEYLQQSALKWKDRDFARCEIEATINPDTGARTDIDENTGLPRCTDAPHSFLSYTSDFDFEDTAELGPNSASIFNGVSGFEPLEFMFSEDGFPIVQGASNDYSATRPNVDINSPSETHNLFFSGDLETDLLGGTRFFVEGGFAKSSTNTVNLAPQYDFTLSSDSPLNPWSLAAAESNPDISPGEITVNVVGRFFLEESDSSAESFRVVLGAEGVLPYDDWEWSVDYQYGQTIGKLDAPVLRQSRLEQALDAEVDENNNLVCVDPSNGCVVLNPLQSNILLGQGGIDPALTGFLMDRALEKTTTKRDEFTLIIDGTLASLPYGDVAMAFGANYRIDKVEHERSSVLEDNDVAFSLFAVETIDNVDADTLGIFTEIEVPIIRGEKWAEDVTANVSGRYTKDDEFDNFSYKASLRYTLSPYVNFRSSYSTSFRSPNLFERFRRPDITIGDIIRSPDVDPCNQYGFFLDPDSVIYQNCESQGLAPDFEAEAPNVVLSGANPQLRPETGSSWIFGVVFSEPEKDVRFAINYFDIRIKNSIRALAVDEVLLECFGSVNLASPFFSNEFIGPRDENGNLTRVDGRDRNSAKDSVTGIDFEFSAFKDIWGWDLSVNAEATHLISRESQQLVGAPLFDLAGTIDFSKWKGDLILGAAYGDLDLTYHVQYIGKMDQSSIDPDFYATDRGRELISTIPNYYYHNVSAGYQVNENLSVNLGIHNLFDKEPPVISSLPFTGPASVSPLAGVAFGEHDLVGRSVNLSLSAEF